MTILRNLNSDIYHSREELNFSTLKWMDVSPLHYLDRRQRRTEQEGKAAFALGGAAHTAILEPDQWEGRYVLQPEDIKVRNGKRWEEFRASQTREILTLDKWTRAQACARAVSRNAVAQRELVEAEKELTVITKLRGVDVRCRFDWIGRSIGDLKTSSTLGSDAFFRRAITYNYLAQSAFYHDCWEAETGDSLPCKMLPVESHPPHDTMLVSLSEDDLDYGRALYNSWLDRLIECEMRGEFLGVSDGVEVPFIMPTWVNRGSDDDVESEGMDWSASRAEE